ncbi:MAG: hypothetical protein Q9196_006719 [Gyalolechia fulgens]
MAESLEMRIYFQPEKRLDSDGDHIRLITIIPLEPDTPPAAPIECQLADYCLNDQHFTPAYKTYLDDTMALGASDDSKRRLRRRGPGYGLGDWIQTARFGDNVESIQPESRYVWGDYLALSYTWGNQADQRDIRVNGEPLLVSENLEACLRVLRSKQYARFGWKFWIDAICINQRDIVERADQVKRMREIYTRAWTPIIWLGKQEKGSDDALDLLVSIANEYSSRDGVNRLTSTLHRNAQHFGVGRWRALNEIICRRYWRRLWILQEVALGRYTTPVLCGERTLRWGQFARAFKTLENADEIINTYIANELKDASLSVDLAIWPNLGTVQEIQFYQDSDLDGKQIDTYRLLHVSRQVFSTDPRDKVYGLLGLLDKRIVALIKPDYTDTVENVYRSFTVAIVKATGSLDAIRHCVITEISNSPSWIPDLTAEPSLVPLTLRSDSFATSGSSSASIRFGPNSHLLPCKGFIADRIDGMGCMWSKGWAPGSVLQTQGMVDPYNTFVEARDAIWKTMVACHSLPSEYLDADYGSLLATPVLAKTDMPDGSPLKDLVGSLVFDWCVKFLKGNAEFKIAGRRMEEYYWKKTQPEHIDAVHLRNALMQRDRINLSRRLVTTERGYVGMALETVERGDAVAVLYGCSMPIVLRESKTNGGDSRWRVIGECYLHGMMNGEAMEWGTNKQDIVLY